MPYDPIGAVVENAFQLQHLANWLAGESDAAVRNLFDDIVAEVARVDPARALTVSQSGANG